MTYPDKTMYPVASTNDADFQNLMHVYMDAYSTRTFTNTTKSSVRKAGAIIWKAKTAR